jgi:hypothetical protein
MIMVRVTIGTIERVGGIEAIHDLGDAFGPEDLKGRPSSLDPALHIEFPQFPDVVGVKVGEENTLYVRGWNTPERQILACFGADIDQKQLVSGNDKRTGFRRSTQREGARGPAQNHAQRILRPRELRGPQKLSADAQGEHLILQSRKGLKGSVGGRHQPGHHKDQEKRRSFHDRLFLTIWSKLIGAD